MDTPVFTFLTGTAPPVTRIEDADVVEALKQLRAAAETAVAIDANGKSWVPGLSIVVVGSEPGTGKNRVLFLDGFGRTNVSDPASIGPDTLFPCASVSKPVSTSLLALAGAGQKPLWTAPAVQGDGKSPYQLKNAPDPKAVPTIREWLSHRAGLPDHAGDLIEDLNPGMRQDELLDRIMRYQTGITPGEYAYTNFGFTMGCLGAMRGVADWLAWEDFAHEQLKQLGMQRSTYRFKSAFDDPTADRAYPHRGQPAVPDLLSPATTGWKWRVVTREEERNPTRQAPAGSLLSSARELGAFLLAHLDKKFGDDFPKREPGGEESLGGSRWYSLGWNVANHSSEDAFKSVGPSAKNAVSFSHSGAFTLGAGTCIRFDPDAGYGIAVLSNGEPTGVPEALSQIFFKYLYATPMPPGIDHADVFALCRVLYLGDLHKKKIANYNEYHSKLGPIPNDLPDGTLLTAHSDYYGCAIVLQHTKPDLLLKIGTQTLKLSRFGESSTYVYPTTGENEVGLSPIDFTWQGKTLVGVDDKWLEESGPGLGKFTR